MEFIVKEINKDYAKFLVFGISANSPLFLLEEIKEQIKPKSGDVVIFDQLLQVGDAENRFLLLNFNDDAFDLGTAKYIDRNFVDNDIKRIVADFLRSNLVLLRYCILPASQKETILQGGVV